MSEDILLRSGDVFCTRGEHRVSRLIRKFTRSKNEGPSVVNHTGLVVRSGTLFKADVVESLAKQGTVRHTLEKYRNSNDQVAVYRPTTLVEIEIRQIVITANRLVGRPYGWFRSILPLALDGLLLDGRPFFARLKGDRGKSPICSYVVAAAFAAAGKDFGIAARQASPDDIWDFMTASPHYEAVLLLQYV